MKSLAEGLPPKVAGQVHPQWGDNERAYWTTRDGLLAQYGGKWVAFAEGSVIAFGPRPLEVFHAGQSSGRHPYIGRVGAEHEPCAMRRSSCFFDLG